MKQFADLLLSGMTGVTFEGWSGQVVFDDATGSRDTSSVLFHIAQLIHDPSDMSLTLSKVCDWSNVREVPFSCDCATCVEMRYRSGLSTAPFQRKAKVAHHLILAAKWIELIGRIVLVVFGLTFLVLYLRAAWGGLPHVAKIHIYYHIQLVYSIVDWYLDMESSANMYETGSAANGLNAIIIMVCNAAISVFFILRVYKHEKSKGNFDFDLFKRETIQMAFVQFAALTNIKIMMYGPWISTLYRGHSSRYAFMVFNLVPLLTENIPQFANQVFYLSEKADPDSLTYKNVTVISTIMSALAIVGTGLKAISTVFMEGDKKMGVESFFDKEDTVDGGNAEETKSKALRSKESFVKHLAEQHSSVKQLARLSGVKAKVTPVEGNFPTREEIQKLEEDLKSKGDDEMMTFKKKVLQEVRTKQSERNSASSRWCCKPVYDCLFLSSISTIVVIQ
jgi:hypothetical protein